MATLKNRAGANREYLATLGAFIVATNAIALRCPNMIMTTMGTNCLAIDPTHVLQIPTRLELRGERFHELHIWHGGVLDGNIGLLDFRFGHIQFPFVFHAHSIAYNKPKVK